MKQFTSYQPHLSHPDYLLEAISKEMSLRNYEDDSLEIEVHVDDLSMVIASGYGTWKVILTLWIDGERKVYSLTHHNEDWYRSQKMVYDNSIADSEEEQNDAIASFQSGYEAVIDANIERIVDACISALESNEEE